MYPRISWTTLKMIEECPKRYELYRQKKRRDVPEKYVLVGNVVHGVAELMFDGTLQTERELTQWANRDFKRRVAEARTLGWDKDEYESQKARMHKAVRELFTIESGMDFTNMEAGWRSEYKITKHYKGWTLEGVMDLVQLGYKKVLEPWPSEDFRLKWGAGEVWDIKTGSSHENGQLVFYAVLCEAWFGVVPEQFGFIEPLGRGRVPVTVSRDDMDEMKDRIVQAASGVSKGEIEMSGFPKACTRCNSADWCPAMELTRKGRLE